jgi:chemotaxis protein methyltransferase CheR
MDDVLRLRDYIYRTTGMYFPDSKRYFFETRFARRLQALKLNSFREYFEFLQREPEGKKEFRELIQEITINETSFFRNLPQLKALVDLVLPDIMKHKEQLNFYSIRIWSAGCSSGEEPYTIAMLIHDRYPDLHKKWKLEILGTDINEKMIEKAIAGEYSEYTMRNIPPRFRNRYFSRNERGYYIAPELKRMVRFEVANLMDDVQMVFLKKFDVIFCRNVLIYFDTSSKKKVIEHFYNNLLDPGYLFLGHSESLYGITDKFQLVHVPGGMIYKKKV